MDFETIFKACFQQNKKQKLLFEEKSRTSLTQ